VQWRTMMATRVQICVYSRKNLTQPEYQLAVTEGLLSSERIANCRVTYNIQGLQAGILVMA
jgi:hypothetical protein